VERHSFHEGGTVGVMGWAQTEVVQVLKGGLFIDDRTPGVCKKHFIEAGSLVIRPAGCEARSLSWRPMNEGREACETLVLQLHPHVLELLAPGVDFRPIAVGMGIRDPDLCGLMQLVEREIAAGAPSGRVYCESLCLALASFLRSRYAATSPPAVPSRSRLSARQRDQLREHIDANLDGDLSLAELARLCSLSPQYFVVAFRATFGTTPHQYVLRQRIVEAKRLLATRQVTIADVALSVGFASQSHFTTAFNKAVGVTPRRYRASVGL
jgi:AraC family transcriptional regulator